MTTHSQQAAASLFSLVQQQQQSLYWKTEHTQEKGHTGKLSWLSWIETQLSAAQKNETMYLWIEVTCFDTSK